MLLDWYFFHFRPKSHYVIHANVKLQEALWGHLERIESLENTIVQKNEKKSFFRLEDQSITFIRKSQISLLEDVKDHSESIHQFGCEIDDIFESIV